MYYARVRFNVVTKAGESISGAWSEEKEYVNVALNKKNFPGLYSLLKKGGVGYYVDQSGNCSMKQVHYDTNKDGWLDPKEITNITTINSSFISKVVNGIHTGYPSAKVSSLQGIEYFRQLMAIQLYQYSGKTADLSKNPIINNVNLERVSASSITIKAPTARYVSMQSDEKVHMNKIDLSNCGNAVEVLAYGSKGTKSLTTKNVKKNKKTKLTSGKGKWWYETKSYRNDMKQIAKEESNR